MRVGWALAGFPIESFSFSIGWRRRLLERTVSSLGFDCNVSEGWDHGEAGISPEGNCAMAWLLIAVVATPNPSAIAKEWRSIFLRNACAVCFSWSSIRVGDTISNSKSCFERCVRNQRNRRYIRYFWCSRFNHHAPQREQADFGRITNRKSRTACPNCQLRPVGWTI